MNTFNRIITIFFLLLLLALFLALAAFPMNALNWLQLQLGNLSSQVMRYQAVDPTNFNIARVAVAAAALLLFLPLLMAETTRRAESVARVRTPGGDAHVTTDSISRRLAWHLDQLADVIAVAPVVSAHGDQVDVRLDVETTPEIEVPMKTEEVMLLTREVVEERMGLKLGRLDVRIRHSSYPEA